jgi:hypothetical protein
MRTYPPETQLARKKEEKKKRRRTSRVWEATIAAELVVLVVITIYLVIIVFSSILLSGSYIGVISGACVGCSSPLAPLFASSLMIGDIQRDDIVPSVTLASIFNDEQALHAGWAVDNTTASVEEASEAQGKYWIFLTSDLALRDSDGWILRLSYHITAKGIKTR